MSAIFVLEQMSAEFCFDQFQIRILVNPLTSDMTCPNAASLSKSRFDMPALFIVICHEMRWRVSCGIFVFHREPGQWISENRTHGMTLHRMLFAMLVEF